MIDDKMKTAEAEKPATPLRQAMSNAERDYVRPAPPLHYGTAPATPATRPAATLARVAEALDRADRVAEALERATSDLERQLAIVRGKL